MKFLVLALKDKKSKLLTVDAETMDEAEEKAKKKGYKIKDSYSQEDKLDAMEDLEDLQEEEEEEEEEDGQEEDKKSKGGGKHESSGTDNEEEEEQEEEESDTKPKKGSLAERWLGN